MRGKELKWLINFNKATLNFDYGKVTLESIVQALYLPGELKLEDPVPHPCGSRVFPGKKCSPQSDLSIVQVASNSDCSKLTTFAIRNLLIAEGELFANVAQSILPDGAQPQLCYSSGILTCSTISSPKPSNAGICMGVFESSRMRRIPRSERIWPPSPIARRMRPLRA